MNWTLFWEIAIPIILIAIPLIIRAIPSESPAKKWVDLVGTILMAILKDRSKVKDEDGKALTHDDIKAVNKVKKSKKLQEFFKVKNK